MQPSNKAAMLTGIRHAQQVRIVEQDTYRTTLKAACDAPVTPSQGLLQGDLAWEGVEQHMAGERWPPVSEDWHKVMGLEWDQTPKHRQLLHIKDSEVRCLTYHYSEVALQTLRLKAAAHFVSRFGMVNGLTATLFACWQAVAMHREIDQVMAATGIGSNQHTHAVPP